MVIAEIDANGWAIIIGVFGLWVGKILTIIFEHQNAKKIAAKVEGVRIEAVNTAEKVDMVRQLAAIAADKVEIVRQQTEMTADKVQLVADKLILRKDRRDSDNDIDVERVNKRVKHDFPSASPP